MLGAAVVTSAPSATAEQPESSGQPLPLADTTKVEVAPSAAVVRGARLTGEQRMLHFTTHSVQTKDLNGVESSLYRGRYFRPSLETKRRCIVKRESNGHYFSISRSGYRGAYQMSSALARGATWMMLPEHRTVLGTEQAKAVLATLRKTPANKWPRYWQDAAFSTIHNWRGVSSGAKHWHGGRWHC